MTTAALHKLRDQCARSRGFVHFDRLSRHIEPVNSGATAGRERMVVSP
jgi:hypothetical protein